MHCDSAYLHGFGKVAHNIGTAVMNQRQRFYTRAARALEHGWREKPHAVRFIVSIKERVDRLLGMDYSPEQKAGRSKLK